MRYLLFLFAISFLASCTTNEGKKSIFKNSLLRNALQSGSYYPTVQQLFPLQIKCKGSNDSILIMTDGGSLYYQYLNIDIGNYEQFAKILAETVENQGYVWVDSILFANLKSDSIVKNECVDSIYKLYGIEGLLHHYVTHEGKLHEENYQIENYLIYLFYKNNIIFYLDDDDEIGHYISFYAREDSILLKKILKERKAK